MSLAIRAMALSGLLMHGAAYAALDDCRLDASENFVSVGRSLRPANGYGYQVAVAGQLRNGEAIRFEKDDVVLAADLTVTRVGKAFVGPQDIVVRQSGFLPLKLRLPAERSLVVAQELALPDGRVFSVLDVNDHGLLVNPNSGAICDAAFAHRVSRAFWVKKLQQEPAGAVLRPTDLRDVTDRVGLRIVFTGLAGGVMTFQELWVEQGKVRQSLSRSFDQLARKVRVGLIEFEVVEAGRAGVVLRYEVRPVFEAAPASLLGAGMKVGEQPSQIVIRAE